MKKILLESGRSVNEIKYSGGIVGCGLTNGDVRQDTMG